MNRERVVCDKNSGRRVFFTLAVEFISTALSIAKDDVYRILIFLGPIRYRTPGATFNLADSLGFATAFPR